MTEQTLPSAGGAWIRQKDGSLTLDEAPTALEPARDAGPATAFDAPIEGGVEPAFKSRRQSAPTPVKEA